MPIKQGNTKKKELLTRLHSNHIPIEVTCFPGGEVKVTHLEEFPGTSPPAAVEAVE